MVKKITYNIDEAVAASGLKRNTLKDWHLKGKLPGSKLVGRTILIPKETVRKLCAGEIATGADSNG